MKVYVVSLIIVLAVIFALLLLLSAEGTAGLWRKILINILIMYGAGIIGLRILMMKDTLFHNAKSHIVLWIVACVLAGLISIPCIKDFSSEHEVREILRSSCSLTSIKNIGHYRYYIILNTGEKIEIATDTYFSLLGIKDCTLTIEYYPNTKTAVKISGYK